MFIVILCVSIIILYTDWECLLYQRLIATRIITLLRSEAITVTMCTLWDTIKQPHMLALH